MRKDKLSSYQAKKEKLQKIKSEVMTYHNYWQAIKENKIRGNNIASVDCWQTIEKIWEIVKNE